MLYHFFNSAYFNQYKKIARLYRNKYLSHICILTANVKLSFRKLTEIALTHYSFRKTIAEENKKIYLQISLRKYLHIEI